MIAAKVISDSIHNITDRVRSTFKTSSTGTKVVISAAAAIAVAGAAWYYNTQPSNITPPQEPWQRVLQEWINTAPADRRKTRERITREISRHSYDTWFPILILNLQGDTLPANLRLPPGLNDLTLEETTIPDGFAIPNNVCRLFLKRSIIPASFRVPPTVTHLELSEATTPAGFRVPPTVTHLYLDGASIPADFRVPPSVTYLSLSGATIPASFRVPPTVTHLDLSGRTTIIEDGTPIRARDSGWFRHLLSRMDMPMIFI